MQQLGGFPAKINNPILPAKYDFNNSVSLNIFASNAATIAVIAGHSSRS